MNNLFHQTFPKYALLSRSGKWLAWITLLQGISWLAVVFTVADGWLGLLMISVAALLNLYASYHIFHRRLRGFRCALLVFVLALFSIRHANGSFIDLSGVVQLTLVVGSQTWQVGVNFLVVLFLWLVYRNIIRLKAEIHAERPEIPMEQI